MDYFSPGFQALRRKFGRQLTRLQMAAELRKLAKAETELGLLGWQQVDFDEETQREVDKIQNYEREQSRLTNESAEFARTLRALAQKRETARHEYEETRRQLEAERRAQVEPVERIQKQLLVFRKQEPQYERRIPDLDRELRTVQRQYTELLTVAVQTPQIRDDLARMRERTVAIPNEKADLRTQHMRVASEIKTLEGQLQKSTERAAELATQLRDLETAFSATDRDLAAELKTQERGKARIEKEIDALEIAKANPYQQIGRVLADNNLAPLNQPNTLEKVRRFRLSLEEKEENVRTSLEICAVQNPEVLKVSYTVLATLAFILLLLVLVLVNLG